jgi:hypothetical protein
MTALTEAYQEQDIALQKLIQGGNALKKLTDSTTIPLRSCLTARTFHRRCQQHDRAEADPQQ